jgi:hypothetical protein
MAPTYKPLSFAMPQFEQPVDFFTAEQAYAKQRATEIAQEAAQADAEMKTRKAEADQKLRGALVEQFGASGDYDPDTAFNIAKRVAAESGDLESMINIEKAQRERSTTRAPLDAQQRSFYEPILGRPIPEGTTMQDLTTGAALSKARTYADATDIYASDPNRQLRADKLAKELTGEQVQKLGADDAIQLGTLEEFGKKVDNVRETYMPYMAANRGERFLAAAANPNSAAARMKNELDLVATELAAAYNGKRLSDLDFKTMSKLVQYTDLDTTDTINDKFDRLKEFTGMKHDTMLESLNKARFNVSKFKPMLSVGNTPTSTVVDNPQNSLPGSSQGTEQTKVVGGVTYKKVPGGWLPQ